ncbi:hypothetical protein Daesc_001212 [Daldinia eschscholtzii]|uniref:Indole-diterpene biosynthesis protein PaxU n=1 Tax=Daldinia eschscholtzii TaxID=292717 RepID=A0AAX6N1T6_9PEZI
MALQGFAKLGPSIFLYTPSEYKTGKLVVLCTWLGAADKHIDKYADIFRKVAPNSKILLLKSFVGSMISPYSKQEREMKPAEHVVYHVLDQCSGTTKPQILFHMMSNGGINSATNLLAILQRKLKKPLPLVGLICDSVPTGASYVKTCRAFMYSFPDSFPLNIVSTVCIHVLISLLYISIATGRYEAPEDYWRKSVLDDKLIDSKRIAYIASKSDKMIDWKDVSSHAELARKKGWVVKEFIFDDTPHCNHISKYEGLYVNTVADLWNGGKL